MATRFTALETFFSEDFQCMYEKGLGYTLDDGNQKLAACVEKWLSEGKVEVGGGTAILTGKG